MLAADSDVLQAGFDVVVISDKEKFQRTFVLAEQQAQLQSRPALENILPQPPDGNPGVNMRTPKGIGDDPQRSLDPLHFRVTQLVQPSEEAGIEENGGASHASVFR